MTSTPTDTPQPTPIDPRTHGPSGRPRARGLRLPVPGTPGPWNAITDVPGVTVGMTTLIEGEAVRTGVTAILPRAPSDMLHPVWAGTFSMNGNGEMTGVHWIREVGWFTGPITITNTLSIGLAHHATARWMADRFPAAVGEDAWVLPVAAETYDGHLNDIAGFHVTEDHVRAAIDGAATGPFAEGAVGGGTGMIAYEFKAGTGTASRRVEIAGTTFTVGVLVQANHGLRPWLTVCGVPVGDDLPGARLWSVERGSIIVIVATDAPLLPTQLDRLARRASIGIGRGGTRPATAPATSSSPSPPPTTRAPCPSRRSCGSRRCPTTCSIRCSWPSSRASTRPCSTRCWPPRR
ncbi:Peptidase family S58 [Methylobrevis pamukkalensis]|uniref:Peptidase family S58 n=1 Tax=Methylobrevis pamukkalensis TaxID=1439726 RepID=A0A1E3H3V2_9HYPH|nr:Peptidase family S58 [Methylobrevis pamukkalensis]